jgi:uncharacterized repeat protein (TIGR03803 family)
MIKKSRKLEGPLLFFLSAVLSASAQPAQTELRVQLLSLFQSSGPIGPEAGLVQDASGAFFGTSKFGGPQFDTGSVFKVSADGIVMPLIYFDNSAFYPVTALTQVSNDCFYGTTEGTIFKIDSEGNLTNIWNFSNLTNGTEPQGDLLYARDGNLYGSAFYSQSGGGTLFKTTLSGDLTTIAYFNDTNGWGPTGRLVEASDECLYGVTDRGGSYEWGTIFKYSSTGGLTTLYSFTGGLDGQFPSGGLLQVASGDLYGVTSWGGQYGFGTLFRFSTNTGLTTLYAFDGTNGANPSAALTQGPDGALYGTTLAGATSNGGTVFCVDSSGALSTIAVFDGTNANASYASLVVAHDGNLYGTTSGGGYNDCGTIYRIVTQPQLRLEKLTVGGPFLSWSSFAGATYRIDTSSGVDGNWIALTNVSADSEITSYAITNGSGSQQFYRVVLLPW